MRDWQRIRLARTDLTDYLIHFTKHRNYFDNKWDDRSQGFAKPLDVFLEILDEGFIRPTFAKIKLQTIGGVSITVRGPEPAVCLTEQPLSAVLVTRANAGSRYSGYGVAYHKYALHSAGGRAVIYGSKELLGTRLKAGEDGFEDGKEVFCDGLPASMQYLFVQYKPTVGDLDDYPIDFTWEREWRIKCKSPGLPIILSEYARLFDANTPLGALIVERDRDVDAVRALLQKKEREGHVWPSLLPHIISLETTAKHIRAGDRRFERIETYPSQSAIDTPDWTI